MRHLRLYIPLLAFCMDGLGQTTVDLRTQSKSADFSTFPSTKPARTGTSLPPACSPGEIFFKLDAAAGKNLFACTATNLWTLLSPPVDLPPVAGHANKVVSTDGTTVSWRALGGDISGAPDAASVQRLQGRSVSSATPANKDLLKWNQAASQWEPAGDYVAGTGISIVGATISADDAVSPLYLLGTAPPVMNCQPGRDFFIDTTNRRLSFCPTANSWQTLAVLESNGTLALSQLPAVVVRTDQAQTFASGQRQSFQASALAAGARLVPASLPSSPVGGDLALDSADNKLKYFDGAAWQGGVAALAFSGHITAAVSANSTRYHNSPGGGWSSTDTPGYMLCPGAGTLRDFHLYTLSSQPGGGSLVVTLRKNGVDTALAVSVPAGSAASLFGDTTTSGVTCAAGDRLTLKGVNSDTAATSANLGGWYVRVIQ